MDSLAFPTPHYTNPYNGELMWGQEGMTLREVFAAQALPAVIQMCSKDSYEGSYEDYCADVAFKMANAMVKRRDTL
jgi:hypothetical protein